MPLNESERGVLAKIGALNCFDRHRRSALWDAEGVFDEEDLFSGVVDEAAPLIPINPLERLRADYDGIREGRSPDVVILDMTVLIS